MSVEIQALLPKSEEIFRRIPLGVRLIQIDGRSALFGRNNISNVFDVRLNFANLRMHVTDQIVLRPRKLFNARCHLMQLFQQRILTG